MNGLHQANDSPEMLRTHRGIGHLPMVLHPAPRRALVIGLGGGATAGAVSQHTGASVDVVELSDSVRRAAARFAHANYAVLDRPNVRLRVDDGRNFLLTTRERYDVVTADIIQPIHAGAGLLYSVEYFTLARGVLADGGLMLQWVGHRPESQYKLIVRSFQAVFPETTVWASGTLLVGATRPLTVSRSAFERQRRDPVTRAALDAAGLDSFDRLLSWYVAGPAELRRFVGPGEVLSDDLPRLEFHRSLPREAGDVDLRPLRDLGELRVVE
jgi:spermidine synthase